MSTGTGVQYCMDCGQFYNVDCGHKCAHPGEGIGRKSIETINAIVEVWTKSLSDFAQNIISAFDCNNFLLMGVPDAGSSDVQYPDEDADYQIDAEPAEAKPPSELKPCPFCGSDDLSVIEEQVVCQNEECHAINADPCDNCFPHIEEWNTRPIEDALLMRAEKAEVRNGKLLAVLRDLYEDCSETSFVITHARVSLDVLEAARKALEEE